jgi:hypothetical protein
MDLNQEVSDCLYGEKINDCRQFLHDKIDVCVPTQEIIGVCVFMNICGST